MNLPLVAQEICNINPYLSNINPSISEGSELYLKATEVLLIGKKLKVSIRNGTKVQNNFKNIG